MSVLRRAPVCVVLAFAGCVALTSELREDGLVYHLPKTILTITVREYRDAKRVWYQIGGEGQIYKADGTATAVSEAIIPDETIPDVEHRYVVKYQPSAFSDDRLCLTRKPNGLLNDVVFAADDRTPEVVFNIARFIAGSIDEKKTSFTGFTTNAEKVKIRAVTTKVDPFSDRDIEAFNATLYRTFRTDIKVSFERMRYMIERSTATWPKGCRVQGGEIRNCPPKAWAERCGPDSICYRTKLKLPVELVHSGHVVDVNYASIINAWDIGTISVTRAFLVHKITKLRFEDGALIAAIVRKPSEVEEASLLPLNVVNAALSVPSGLWANAFGNNNSAKEALLKQQADFNTQLATLSTQQKALQAALQTGSPVSLSDDKQYSSDCRDAVSGGGLNWIQ